MDQSVAHFVHAVFVVFCLWRWLGYNSGQNPGSPALKTPVLTPLPSTAVL